MVTGYTWSITKVLICSRVHRLHGLQSRRILQCECLRTMVGSSWTLKLTESWGESKWRPRSLYLFLQAIACIVGLVVGFDSEPLQFLVSKKKAFLKFEVLD